MNSAINERTSEMVLAWTLKKNPNYNNIQEEKWYADPNEIESYNKELISDITKIEVVYREGTTNITNKFGTTFDRSPCFVILEKDKLGINTIPESEEHKKAKNWMYNRIEKKDLIFSYSKVKKPYEYDNTIKLDDLKVDYKKVGIEVVVKSNSIRKADIIIPFIERDLFFGAGIVIEIQFSYQREKTTERRTNDWAQKGYSTVWLYPDDFKDISTDMIELYQDNIKLEPHAIILQNQFEEYKNELRVIAQKYVLYIQQLSDKIKEEIDYDGTPKQVLGVCPKCKVGQLIIRSGRFGDFYGCTNYPDCNKIVKVK